MRLSRLLSIALVGLFLLLQYQLWLSPGGLISAWRLQHRVDAQSQTNAKLNQRNEALRADVKDLSRGNEAIEERARNMGLVKPKEKFYQVVPQK